MSVLNVTFVQEPLMHRVLTVSVLTVPVLTVSDTVSVDTAIAHWHCHHWHRWHWHCQHSPALTVSVLTLSVDTVIMDTARAHWLSHHWHCRHWHCHHSPVLTVLFVSVSIDQCWQCSVSLSYCPMICCLCREVKSSFLSVLMSQHVVSTSPVYHMVSQAYVDMQFVMPRDSDWPDLEWVGI